MANPPMTTYFASRRLSSSHNFTRSSFRGGLVVSSIGEILICAKTLDRMPLSFAPRKGKQTLLKPIETIPHVALALAVFAHSVPAAFHYFALITGHQNVPALS